MLLNDDATRLRHMIEAAEEAIGYVGGIEVAEFRGNRPLQHAVVRCIEIVGEAANRLSPALRDSNPRVPWADIIVMRNRIVHAYFDIDVEIVWMTAREDLPVLLEQVRVIHQGL